VGAGALGPVFRCYDPETDRAVAVKALPLDITPEQASELAAALAHLATLNLAHPSIIAPLGAGADGSTAFLVQEYFVAESVDVALRQYGPAPIPDALRLVGQLAGAIDFAAVTGVRHGSLHPRDILVAPHEVRLTGLGVAQSVEQIGFRVAPRLPYSAPERVEGLPWTTAADVFALAAVAFELLTGKRPSTGAEPFTPETTVSGAADQAALAEAFARAFSVRAEDRFPTALSFAAALRHALTGEPLEAPAAATQHPHVARRRERGSGRASRLPLEPKPETGPASDRPDETASAVPVIVEPPPPRSLEEPVPSAQEPVSSAADQLLEAPERADADVSLEPPELEPSGLEEEPLTAAERFGAVDAVAESRSPQEQGEERFAALEPFAETESPREPDRFAAVEPPAGPERPARPEQFSDLEPDAESEPLAGLEPRGFGRPPGIQDEPLATEPLARPDRLEVWQAAAEPSRRELPLEPPSVEPLPLQTPHEPAPAREPAREPAMDETPVRRADEIRMTPREEVPMPSPPAMSTGPDRPFAPPPSGRGTASFGRPRLPLSWLLAMLLLGVLGGFVGGYLLGSGDHRGASPAGDAKLPETEAAPSAEAARQSEPPAPPAAVAPPPTTASQPSPAGGAPKPIARPAGAATPPAAGASTPALPATKKPAAKPAPPPASRRRSSAPAPSRPARPSTAAAAPASEAAGRSARFEGSLVVISRPPGAMVRLDGRAVGKTPLTLSAIGAGSHAVRIELDGYRPWSAAIQVVAGTQNRVTASLEQRPGGIDE